MYGTNVGGRGMAKVTVYVTDEQLARLRGSKNLGKGGMSKAFQAFLENVMSGDPPGGRRPGGSGADRAAVPGAAEAGPVPRRRLREGVRAVRARRADRQRARRR